MSDIYCYVGPFFKCKVREVSSLTQVNACPNQACICFKKDISSVFNFCHQCGTKISKFDIPAQKHAVDISSVRDAIRVDFDESLIDLESLSNKKSYDAHIWISNKSVPHLRSLIIMEADMIVSIPDIEIEKRIFLEFFKKEYNFLRKTYGEDEVIVDWGIYTYN